jgi:membrane-bound serine protease (ClpP class)
MDDLMRRAFLPLLLATAAPLALVGGIAGARSAPSTTVEVIKIEGAIDRPLIGYVQEKLTQAESEHAVVVLQLDTAGTLDQDGVALAERVANLRVPVIAWVGPAPSRASGTGLLLMYAASVAAVYPGSQTGPLMPLDLAHPDLRVAGLQDTIRGWLESRGRTGATLDRPDVALNGQQAVQDGVAALSAQSVPDLLDQVDGRQVQTPGGPVILHTRVATTAAQARTSTVDIRFENLGPVKRTLHAVASPSMIYFLVVIGAAALAFELTQPGFGFAGFSGLALLALAVYGMTVVPASWLGLALLVGGIAALAADVLLRKLGPLTAIGLIAFGAGSILAWRGVAPAIAISPWLIGGAVIASLLYYGFALTVALQSRDRIVSTQRGLIGLVGESRGRMAPDGPVFVKGALWRGRSSNGEIAEGTRVRVRGVDGLVLRVEPEPGSEREPEDPAT